MIVAIHRTFEKHEKSGERDIALYVSGGKLLRGIRNVAEWVQSLSPNSTIRAVPGDSCDPLLAQLVAEGHSIACAHWHSCGIEKGCDPDELVERVAALPDNIFRPLVVRPDLIQLKALVDKRNIFVDERTRAVQRIRALARAQGMASDVDYDESTNELLSEARSVRGRTKQGGYVNIVTDLERAIAEKASEIAECVLLNRIAGIADSWILAAEIVVLFRGLEGFANVAKAWKFAGHSVDDGKCPKRAKGKVLGHNPRLLPVLWQLGSVLVMHRKQPWRSLFEQYREQELATHDAKHPDCKTKRGHSTARAMRRMRKEFLKQWFLEVKRSQADRESQRKPAPLGARRGQNDAHARHSSAKHSGGQRGSVDQIILASEGRDRRQLDSHVANVAAEFFAVGQRTIEPTIVEVPLRRGKRAMFALKSRPLAPLAAKSSNPSRRKRA